MTLTIDFISVWRYLPGILFAVVGIFLFVMIVGKVRNFIASHRFERNDLEAMRRRWREIVVLLKAPGEVSHKLAIIEADKLLDQALKSLAMPGETLGERLKFVCYKHPELKEVWWAHRIRNQLVHEATYHLDGGLAYKAVKQYGRALRRLGAI
ncbi:MAG: hypothetical protein WCT10_01035 [Patescibacteria group bacterium]|jgi:hypothetical protein